jgi:integrase
LNSEPVRVLMRRAVLEVEKKLIAQGTKTHAVRNVGLRPGDLSDAADAPGPCGGVRCRCRVTPLRTDLVFQRSPGSGHPLPPDRVSQAWQRLYKELGVKASAPLRHLHASLLPDAGEAITTVAARLGQRDTFTTLKVYAP